MIPPQDMFLIIELSTIHDIFLTSTLKFIQEILTYCRLQIPDALEITQRYESHKYSPTEFILSFYIRIYVYLSKLQGRLRSFDYSTSLYSAIRELERNSPFILDCLIQEFLLKQ